MKLRNSCCVDADHSGGLMHFIDTNVPIYVHDLELRNALWCLYTKVRVY